MKHPEDYPKALYLLQGIDTFLYVLAAVVIYCFGGEGVASPALGSTSHTVSKVAYGIAIPTVSCINLLPVDWQLDAKQHLQIVVAGIINGHVATKYIYVRLLRGSGRMHQRSLLAIGTWVGIVCTLYVLAWIIAEGIPIFNNLLSLMVRRRLFLHRLGAQYTDCSTLLIDCPICQLVYL
jgi:hypothetical protein